MSTSDRPFDAGGDDNAAVSLARIQRLRDAMPDNSSLVDELIDLFFDDLKERLAAIVDAVNRADARTLALQAHALRSGAGNFGASRLDALCWQLEQIGQRGEAGEAAALLEKLDHEAEDVRRALLEVKSNKSSKTAGPTDL
jgi:HPt (histidine-containing phosphotransfer) domain-containing protein